VREALLDILQTRRGASYTSEKVARRAVQEVLLSASAGKTPAFANAVADSLAVQDPDSPVVTDRVGNTKPAPDLRDYENVPLPNVRLNFEADPTARLDTTQYRTIIDDYMTREVLPYVSDAWYDRSKTKIGYEIPLSRYFYTYTPPRSIDDINDEIMALEAEIQVLLGEVAECNT